MTENPRYLEPGWFTRNVFNRAVRRLTVLGISVWGSRELRVRGVPAGEWRTTPVNLLGVEGRSYLVSPRGITQWVRNLRVAEAGELRVGARVEPFDAREVEGDIKIALLREYVRRWKFEVGAFFPGLTAKSSDAEYAAVADGFPVFEVLVGHNPTG